jgi:hypothetical protein
MATVQLRLRGVTVPQIVAGLISAGPLLFVGFEVAVRHVQPPLSLTGLSVLVAGLPWLSRAAARATYRAKCDDIAVHVRGEALPYKTIKEVRVERSPRRDVLHLIRSEDIQLELVLRDAFAGRLEPLDELEHRLSTHGFKL